MTITRTRHSNSVNAESLTPGQWSLLRLLARHAARGGGKVTLDWLLGNADADMDELFELVDHRLITFGAGMVSIQPEIPVSLTLTSDGDTLVRVHLVPLGEVLTHVRYTNNRGAEIPDIVRLVAAGWLLRPLFVGSMPMLELRDREREVVRRPGWEEACTLGGGSNWPGLRVHLTYVGRRYQAIP